MKKFLFAALTVYSALFCTVNGAVLNFRSGTIIAAEISAAEIKIRNLDPVAFPALPEKRLCAVLSVKLAPGRKISIFDYSLESSGATYPCVAINTGRRFISREKDFSPASAQLLFILEERNMPAVETMNIKCNLPPTDGTYDIKVPFKYIRNQAPTRLDRIPASGLLEKI